MDAKLGKISEMAKLLSVKSGVCDTLLTYFGKLGLSQALRRLSLEKQQGHSAVELICSLCIFRLLSESIHSMYAKRFCSVLDTGKNCYYRLKNRPVFDWRSLLLAVARRYMAIIRKENAVETEQPSCLIIDDTTLAKTGTAMERISKVYDHVTGKYVYGFKLLLLAFFDGRSTLPIDFSIHSEQKDKNFGLTKKQRSAQFSKKRPKDCPASVRLAESLLSKIDMAIDMLRRAWKTGFRVQYVLCDSWFTCEKLIQAVRALGKGAVHFLGLAKMGNAKYLVNNRLHTAAQLVAKYEREHHHTCRKYKCCYITLRGSYAGMPVKIFLIKYGRSTKWNILITTDLSLNFIRAFELYQIRWNIEVLFKESKQYLGLGAYQGRDFDGQIADCTICFLTYTVMALQLRLSHYEVMGELFRSERERFISLTLWKRVLDCLNVLLRALEDILDIDLQSFMLQLCVDEKYATKINTMVQALLQLEELKSA